MPVEHRCDPTLLDAVATHLARSSAAALSASDELLSQYSDTGDAPTQRAVDTLVIRVSDAIEALAVCFADAAVTVQGCTPQTATGEAFTRMQVVADGTRADSGCKPNLGS